MMSVPSDFGTQVAKNKARRVWFWLTIISVLFLVFWIALAATAASEQDELDARCEESNIILDDDWAEKCGEALGNSGATAVFVILALLTGIFTVVSIIVFYTRDKYKEVIVKTG